MNGEVISVLSLEGRYYSMYSSRCTEISPIPTQSVVPPPSPVMSKLVTVFMSISFL